MPRSNPLTTLRSANDRQRALHREGINLHKLFEYAIGKTDKAREHVIATRAWQALQDQVSQSSQVELDARILTDSQRTRLAELHRQAASEFTYDRADPRDLQYASISSLSDHLDDLNDAIATFCHMYEERAGSDICEDRRRLLSIISRVAHTTKTLSADPGLIALLKQVSASTEYQYRLCVHPRTVMSDRATGTEITDNEDECTKDVNAAWTYVQSRLQGAIQEST
jgi:hypothetical protein